MQERELHAHDQRARHDEAKHETDKTGKEPTKSWPARGGGR